MKYPIKKSNEQLVFKDNLAHHIKLSGMSIASISRESGIPSIFFHRGFNCSGFKTVQVTYLPKLADCLGVSVNDLFSAERGTNSRAKAISKFNGNLQSDPELITKFYRALQWRLYYE